MGPGMTLRDFCEIWRQIGAGITPRTVQRLGTEPAARRQEIDLILLGMEKDVVLRVFGKGETRSLNLGISRFSLEKNQFCRGIREEHFWSSHGWRNRWGYRLLDIIPVLVGRQPRHFRWQFAGHCPRAREGRG